MTCSDIVLEVEDNWLFEKQFWKGVEAYPFHADSIVIFLLENSDEYQFDAIWLSNQSSKFEIINKEILKWPIPVEMCREIKVN